MNEFYVIGQHKYNMELQVSLQRLISNEQTNLLSSGKSFTNQEEIILYGVNNAMHKNDNYPDHSHLYYLNKAGKKLLDDHGIKVDEVLNIIQENELPKHLSVLIRNIRFY